MPGKFTLPRKLVPWLETVPAIFLSLALLVAMFHWPLSLAGIEPFDAFFFLELVSVGSVVIAILGLIASALVPMAYCRFGCPTGALLSQLKYSGRSDRLTRRDVAAVLLLGLAVCIFLTS